ncbi:MAG TPA: signal peptide peptidase SppA [Bacteroidota bacterium]|nr:signal peptide peptidase SppA [Bacteroidota bacterium]
MSKSAKWFLAILAVLLVVGGVFLLFLYSALRALEPGTRETVVSGRGEKLAIVELKGPIESSEEIVRQLKKYREDESVKGIVLRIDSPGGGVVASQEMYEEVKKTREGGKPVVVSMGSLAASGGYYVACGASRLVANPGSLTGSIGVIGEFLQLHEALNKLGIGVKTIKSGRLKDAGSLTQPMSKDAEKYFQSLMDDVHDQFIRVVEKERQLDHNAVMAIADGRVFTGEHALTLGLIDTLGTFEDAIRIAADLAGIKGEPALVRERERKPLLDRILNEVGLDVREVKNAVFERPVLSYRFVPPF